MRSAGAVAAVVALAGCAAGYDAVLWRQMDAEESAAYAIVTAAKADGSSQDTFLSALKGSPGFWHEGSSPPVDGPDAGATFFYNVDDSGAEAGEGVVTFDVFVHSGLRPQGMPREEPGSAAGGAYTGPPSVYTCFRLEVTFAGDRLWNVQRTHDYGDDRLVCPQQLVDAIGDGATYEEPTEFDG